jgi:hypothetical protein
MARPVADNLLTAARKFRDRVRGEVTHPWGVAEAMALGITPQGCRDLVTPTEAGAGCLNFHYPEMQECLLALAQAAGADVRRPADNLF